MTPPNILYLHSHDTGRWVQPYGHQIPTPNIQMLADQGALFRQAFCAGPTCSGSRASLLTGQYPHSNGMMGLAHRGWRLNDYGQHILHTLREAGYRSELIGEQHVSEDLDMLGYDEVHRVARTNVELVAPEAVRVLRAGIPEPWFLSIGFFETHRSWFAPTSMRDSLYSLTPPNLPDTPLVREDVAAFKASARSLDQGVGRVLNALHAAGMVDNTLIVFTTDHGLAFPGAKGTLYDRGTGVMLVLRGPGGFLGGRVVDELVSQIDLYPTICELAEIDTPSFAQGCSLLPMMRGESPSVRDAVFTELTYHAAYDPQRAVRTERWKYVRRFDDYPTTVLPNVDDSPSKDVLVDAGWGDRPVPREQLFDMLLDPEEGVNLANDPAFAHVRAELAERLERQMRETDDPLLEGPVPAPAGVRLNRQDQVSAEEPTYTVGAAVEA
ncbi:MAG: N-sulfoglucosamine sulfohydrolase [Thermoleophilaceae bacterium]|jgi:arylsulfatase A-like enzyme|nr:N-sulfoglucosamine sulfohydrolase [Thermoleophilaceae bacterium]